MNKAIRFANPIQIGNRLYPRTVVSVPRRETVWHDVTRPVIVVRRLYWRIRMPDYYWKSLSPGQRIIEKAIDSWEHCFIFGIEPSGDYKPIRWQVKRKFKEIGLFWK